MAEIHLGTHTIRSHGVEVARLHMHDWLILVLLVVIEVILNIINLFYRFVGESMMTDLRYPLQDNTVPFWAVPAIIILLPFAIFLVYYLFRRDVYDLHQAILGLLFSVLITDVITNAIKDAVGRPRPDFFWLCFPDGKPEYDSITRGVICHDDRSVVKEGHKSFPRLTVASFCYLQFFPPPYDPDVYKMQQDVKLALPETYQGDNLLDFDHSTGWGPHALFHMLEETRNDNQQSSEVNRLQIQGTELREIYIPSEDCLDTSVVATRDNIHMINGFGAGRRS